MLPFQCRIYTVESHEIMGSDGAISSLMPSDEEKIKTRRLQHLKSQNPSQATSV
jgi:hypothetical protein